MLTPSSPPPQQVEYLWNRVACLITGLAVQSPEKQHKSCLSEVGAMTPRNQQVTGTKSRGGQKGCHRIKRKDPQLEDHAESYG